MTMILAATGLHKSYPMGDAEIEALRGVDVELAVGEFVAVMGPSGSGKTTLLELLAGLETPDSGEIKLAGQDLTKMSDDDRSVLRRRHIGVVYQFFNLLPTLTATENVALPLMLAGERPVAYLPKAEQALGLVGLSPRANHLPGQLSGGEQQRVAIARGLVAEPILLLADEPTGNLDRSASERTLAAMRRACDQRNQSILLVTHDPLTASYADRVLFLRDGRLVDELPGPRPRLQDIVDRLARLETRL